MQEVFQVGDRVRAVVLSAEDNYTRFSLSTAELEEQPGDMLRDRVRVVRQLSSRSPLSITHAAPDLRGCSFAHH